MKLNFILASSSKSRQQLLQQACFSFSAISPNVDETAQPDESPEHLVTRLSLAKALAVSTQYPDALVIGSDQIAVCEATVFGKPLTRERAQAQLEHLSGKKAEFLTGLCVIHPEQPTPCIDTVSTHVVFRTLSTADIARYLDSEQPYHCAASFKSETAGAWLTTRISSDDPTALIGLPLLRLIDRLYELGLDPWQFRRML